MSGTEWNSEQGTENQEEHNPLGETGINAYPLAATIIAILL